MSYLCRMKLSQLVTIKIFILKKKEFVTPHLIRVHLENDDVSFFKDTTLGGTCKLLFPPLGIRDIHYAEYDEENQKWISPSEKFKPVSRTYTLRDIDAKNNVICKFCF